MSKLSAFQQLIQKSTQPVEGTPDLSIYGQANPQTVKPNMTRSLGEFVGDTALAIPEGLANTADTVTSALRGKPSNYLTQWVQGFESNKLKAQLAEEQQEAAAQSAKDERNHASLLTRIAHGTENFLRSPIHSTGVGIGQYLPASLAGEAAPLAMVGIGGLQGNKEAMERGDTGGNRASDIVTGAVTAGALHKLAEATGGAGNLINRQLSGDAAGAERQAAIDALQQPNADATKAFEEQQAPSAADIDGINKKYAANADDINATAARNAGLSKYLAAHTANQFVGNGLGGGAINATGAAINGQDPGEAFGEGIGMGLGAAGQHLGTHAVGAGLSLGARAGVDGAKAGTSGLSKAYDWMKENLKSKNDTEKETKDTAAANETIPTSDDNPQTSSNGGTPFHSDEADQEAANASEKEGQEEPESTQEGIMPVDASLAHIQQALINKGIVPDEAATVVSKIGKNDSSLADEKLESHGAHTGKVFVADEDGKPTLSDIVTPEDISNYLGSGLDAAGVSKVGNVLRNEEVTKSLHPSVLKAIAAHLGDLDGNKEVISARYGVGKDIIAKNITPEQYDQLNPLFQQNLKDTESGRARDDLKDPKADDVLKQADILFSKDHSDAAHVDSLVRAHQLHDGAIQRINNIKSNLPHLEGNPELQDNFDQDVNTRTRRTNSGRLMVRPGAARTLADGMKAIQDGDKERSAAIIKHAQHMAQTPAEVARKAHENDGGPIDTKVNEASYLPTDNQGRPDYQARAGSSGFSRDLKSKDMTLETAKNAVEVARIRRDIADKLSAEHKAKFGEDLGKTPTTHIDAIGKDKGPLADYVKENFNRGPGQRPTGSNTGRFRKSAESGFGSRGNKSEGISGNSKGSNDKSSQSGHSGGSSNERSSGSGGNSTTESGRSKTPLSMMRYGINDVVSRIKSALESGKDLSLEGSVKPDEIARKAADYGFKRKGDLLVNPMEGEVSDVYQVAKGKIDASLDKLNEAIGGDKKPSTVLVDGAVKGKRYKQYTEALKSAGYEEHSTHMWTHEGEDETPPPGGDDKSSEGSSGSQEGENGRPFQEENQGQQTPQDSSGTSIKSDPKTVFISGSKNFGNLSEGAKEFIQALKDKGYQFIVGDSKQSDAGLHNELPAENTTVHHIGKEPNTTIDGSNTQRVKYPKGMKPADAHGFRDETMANKAGAGVAFWDTKSTGTLRNIINLVKEGKPVRVYTPNGSSTDLVNNADLHRFYNRLPNDVKRPAVHTLMKDVPDTDGIIDSNAKRFFQRTEMGNTLHKSAPLDRIEENFTNPGELHKDIAKEVDPDVYKVIKDFASKAIENLTGSINKGLDILKEKDLKKFNRDNGAHNLLGPDGKVDPKLLQYAVLAVMDTLHNTQHTFAVSKSVDDAIANRQFSIQASTASARSVRTMLRMLDANLGDHIKCSDVEGPLALLVNGVLDHLRHTGGITQELRKSFIDDSSEREKTVLYLTKLKSITDLNDKNQKLPSNWLSNMIAENQKAQKFDYKIGEKATPDLDSGLPKNITDVLTKESAKAYKLSKVMTKLVRTIGPDWAEAFMPDSHGYLKGYEKIRYSRMRPRFEAVNFLEHLFKDQPEDYDPELYFAHHSSSNARVMMSGSMNPQANKTLRALLAPFSAKVKLEDGELLPKDKYWRLALAQSLGVKIERNTLESTLEKLPSLLKQHNDLQQAIHDVLYENHDPAKLVDMIRRSDLEEHGVAALAELVALHNEGEIDSRLALEADGITNGPAAGLTTFGDIHSPYDRELMAKAGFYINGEGDKYAKHQQKIDGANEQDLYEKALANMPETDQIFRNNAKDDLVKDILNRLGFLKDGVWARNFLKQPIQMSTYLAGEIGIGESIKGEVYRKALELVDSGELPERVLNILGIERPDAGGFTWAPIPHSPDLRNQDLFYRLGKATKRASESAYPRHISDKVRILGFSGWLRNFLIGVKLRQMNEGEFSRPTFGQRKELLQYYRDNAARLSGNYTDQPYAPIYAKPRKSTFIRSIPVDGITKGINYHPSEITPDLFHDNDHPDAAKYGYAVSSIQNLGDSNAVVWALQHGYLDHALQVFDGINVNPQDAFKIAQIMNEGFSNILKINPFDTNYDFLKNNDLMKAEDLDSMGLTPDEKVAYQAGAESWLKEVYGDDSTPGDEVEIPSPQEFFNLLTEHKETQDQRIDELSKLQKIFEQFSVGDGGKDGSSQYVIDGDKTPVGNTNPNISSEKEEPSSNTFEGNTSKQLEQLRKTLENGKTAEENPVGHSISQLIYHNEEALKNVPIHQTADREELNNTLKQYGVSDRYFDDNTIGGLFIPGANGGNGALLLHKTGSIARDSKVMLHELTHAMITQTIKNSSLDDPHIVRLQKAMEEVANLKVPKDNRAYTDHQELKNYLDQTEGKVPQQERLNEFAARFISSPSLIREATKKRTLLGKLKVYAETLGKMVFGVKFHLSPGSVGEHAFNAIAGLTGKLTTRAESDQHDLLFSKDYSDTQQQMFDAIKGNTERDKIDRKLLEQAFRAENEFAARQAINDLQNNGWKFSARDVNSFILFHANLNENVKAAAPYLRDLAPKVDELIARDGTGVLGTKDYAKNLMTLAHVFPDKFKDIKMPSLTDKKRTVTDYVGKFDNGVGSWDNSRILSLVEKAGGFTQYANDRANEMLDKHLDSTVDKLTKGKVSLKGVDKIFREELPKLLDNSRMPHALREVLKTMAPVLDSEVPLLGSIRQWRGALDRGRQIARSKLPAALKKEFKTKLSKDETDALFKASKTDFVRYDSWRDMVEHNADEPIAPRMSDSAKKAADNLAQYLATGEIQHNLHPNADIIAKRYGGNAKAIDRYIGEKAYSLLDKDTRDTLAELYNRDREGVESVLGYHQDLQDRNRTFGGFAAKYNALKGFMPNEYKDSSLNMAAVEEGSEQHEAFKKLGYSQIGTLERNAGEKDKASLLVLAGRHSGNVTSNQGGLSRIKFSVGGYNADSKTNATFPLGIVHDLKTYSDKGGKLRPIFDANGEVTHYERQFDTPEKLKYTKHDDIFDSLGAYEGNLFEMSTRDAMNQAQLSKLHDMYKESKDGAGFVNIAKSNDPVIKQAYNALPPNFHRQAEATFGKKDFVPVPRSLVNDFLGYKKASVGDFWTGDTRWSPKVQKIVIAIAHKILGERAYQHLMGIENILESGVGAAQRMIAVGSIVIPLRNMCADILQLMSSGISLKTIATRGVEIAKDLKAYNRANQNIYNLKAAMARRDMSEDMKSKYMNRIQAEEERIKNLRVSKLIDAGMYSVVDDNLNPNHSSDGMITPYIDAAMDKMPKGLATVARSAFVTKDSHLFHAIQQGVETTDFIARTLMYEHNLKELGHEKAVQKAMNAFVDYGRAKGRTRDKLESIGAIWFWNTKLRSMAVAGQLLRDNPLLAILYSHNPIHTNIGFLNNLATPLTDNILTQFADGKVGYSLGWGPFGSAWQMNPFWEATH